MDGVTVGGQRPTTYARGVNELQPPAGSVLPDRPAHAPAPGTAIPSHYRWCFGCGVDHPAGLHLSITAGEGLVVRGTFLVTELHQGAPGLAHGGVLTTAFDEVLGSLNWLLGDPVVTGRLTMTFRAPVPVGSTLTIDAQVTGVLGRKVFAAAVGTLPDGRLAVSAESVFIKVPLEHFIANGNPEHIELAIADRAAGGPSWRAGETQTEVNP